jgi:hypothetical protein
VCAPVPLRNINQSKLEPAYADRTDAQGRSVPTYLVSVFRLSSEEVGTKITARPLPEGRAFSDSAMVALHAHEEDCVHGQGFHIGFSSILMLQHPRLSTWSIVNIFQVSP